MSFRRGFFSVICCVLAVVTVFSACAISQAAGTLSEDAALSTSSDEVVVSPTDETVTDTPTDAIPESEPEPEVILSTTIPEQGSYIMIMVRNISAEGVAFTDFLGYERSFIPYEDGYFCFIPIKVAADPKSYTLSFAIGDFEFSDIITVVKREFRQQYLTVDSGTLSETLESEEANTEYYNAITPLKTTYTPEKLWDGAFELPLKYEYKETTAFGTYRTYSNGSFEYHNATDMAAPGGTPVYATNGGKVIFAQFLKLTGNTVLIDHGMGVISWYYHMNTLLVEAGDTVTKGAQIGTVGTTGLSTGNHLHFGITVCGINTDPIALMGTEPQIDFWKEAAV